MNYQQKLEKQNEQLREKLKTVSLGNDKFILCEEFIDKRLILINKKILDLYNNSDEGLGLYTKNIETCYEDERKFLLILKNSIERVS